MARFENAFSSQLKKIGVYTSGGDAPGMNAAIRAVVRTGIHQGFEIVGISHGYAGMISGEFEPLQLSSVANILQRGGTVLKTGRSQEFLKPEYRAKAAQTLKDNQIDALVCIGGDGSFNGAQALWKEHQVPVIGLPGTIDNDIYGTDITIGYDTAVNTALEAIDRIRDTAASHDRLFIVEVMGRNSGFIAVDVGVAGGAEEVFIPETPTPIEKAIEHIQRGVNRGKTSSILVTAEGQKPGRAYDLAEAIRKKSGYEAKVCILGHVQRGGAPTATDRILASRLGAASIEALKARQCNGMLGLTHGKVSFIDFTESLSKKKVVSQELIHLAQILSI